MSVYLIKMRHFVPDKRSLRLHLAMLEQSRRVNKYVSVSRSIAIYLMEAEGA